MATEAVIQYMSERAHLPTRTLAREIAEQFPDEYRSDEHARDSVRYYRQEKGIQRRKDISSSGNAVPVTKYSSPEPCKATFKPFILPPVGDGLIVADLHVPYHDKAAIDTTINYAINKGHTKHLTILGDLNDFYSISYFNRDPRAFCLESEADMSTKFLEDMTNIFDVVIFKAGNHDVRLERYIWQKAPELAGLKCLSLPDLLDLRELGVKYVSPYDPIYAGDNLTLIHGHEYGRGVFSPVNAARGLFLRTLACGVSAHLHRTSHHDEPDVRGKDISTWSVGCLCDLHPRYAPLNKWNHGFAVFNFEGGDDWDFSNHRIINGHVR